MFAKTTIPLLLSSIALAYPTEQDQPQTQTRNETSINWQPCDLEFPSDQREIIAAHGAPIFCAKLPVPLDYTVKDGEILELQLIKVEAIKEPFKGSIIMNPGGPGSSGVVEISQNGPMYRDVFGGQYDVIGLDARGTGRTMPFACIPSNSSSSAVSKRAADFTVPQVDDLYSILESKAFDDGAAFVETCTLSEGNADIGSYLGTAFVARDLLQIVDALNEDGLLRFWGRSYSSVLGQTFASMFPDRVGRILLDSVFRFDDYFSGRWATAPQGTEASMLNFFRECVAAGIEICPLANFTGADTTPQDLLQELGNGFQQLLDEKIMLPDNYQPPGQLWWRPGGITLYQELKYWMLTYLYRPEQYLALYSLADAVIRRDWDAGRANLEIISNPPGANETTPELPWHLGINAFHGIACSDASFRAESPEDMYSLVQTQLDHGSWADVFSPQVWPCAQWKFEAKERYTGPFTAIKTKNPILMVNGAHDPITGLSGAWEASANFIGSRLLVHNGHGHGVMNHASNCTIKAIHDYFNDGILPEVGTECEPNQTAFEYALEYLEKSGNGTSTDSNEARGLGMLV